MQSAYARSEAAKSLIISPSNSHFHCRAHLRHNPPSSSSSSSSSGHQEQGPLAVATALTTSLPRSFPTSVLSKELPDGTNPFSHTHNSSQAASNKRQMEIGLSVLEENDPINSDRYLHEFQPQLLHWQSFWYLSPSSQMVSSPSLISNKQPAVSITKKKVVGVEPFDVVTLAKKALSASKYAASLAEDQKLLVANHNVSLKPGSESTTLASFLVEPNRIVRSSRYVERQSKKRVKKPIVQKTFGSKLADLQRSKSKAPAPDDALRLFSWVPETKQLLSAKEESELIVRIQELMRLEEVKDRLNAQFGREPTMFEWAEATGITCRALKSQLNSGNNSREKLIYANFRLVVHIAKKYIGRGLNFQDLLQEGSMGLMCSVQKYKPQSNCRFATYAFWWIRQAVRKAIFLHSRTIRLPEGVYGLLYKVTEAKRQCIQEGHHHPTKEQIAAHVGITVDRLEMLQYSARTPLSMQQPVWTDQNTNFRQITADKAVETPKVNVEKQLMRQHIRNLLGVLNPRERKVICLRYGIEGDMSRTLADIGAGSGLSKERVRQLESGALDKLKQCLDSEGLNAYEDLLF